MNQTRGHASGSVYLNGTCIGSGSTKVNIRAGTYEVSLECPPFFGPSEPQRVVIEPGGQHEVEMSCGLRLSECECRNTMTTYLGYRACNAATPTQYAYYRCEGVGYCSTEDFMKVFGGTYRGR